MPDIPALPRTRLVEAPSLARGAGDRVFLKLECELPTGSFKVRGALHALLNAGLKPRATNGVARGLGPASVTNVARGFSPATPAIKEVVASSTGNHGAAVAWAAQQLGVRATIFLPQNPNPAKRANIAQFGATIVEVGKDLSEASDAASRYTEQTGAFFLNDATDSAVPEGAGRIADEILDDLPGVDTIYVPVGDTALIRGVARRAKALKPSVRIIGVQAERAPSYYLSWQSGTVTPTDTADTIADGLATRTPVADNVRAIRELVDDMRLVSEDAMVAAIVRLRGDIGVTAEPAAASTVAAYLQESTAGPRTIVLLITGRNIAPDVLRQAEGRL